MLSSLHIANYALIENQEIHFQPGLIVITGETGAGKSIILDALGLILGDRAEYTGVRNPEQKCIVEGHFNIDAYNLANFFSENELDYDSHCILRRELLPGGKSRAFINDCPVNLNVLKSLGEKLIDIHNQHQSQFLNNPDFQLDLLDQLHGNSKLLELYKSQYKELLIKRKQLEELSAQLEAFQKEKDFKEFQLNELTEAKLVNSSELQELEEELFKLNNLEHIKQNAYLVLNILDNEDRGALNSLNLVKSLLAKVASFDKRMDDFCQSINSIEIELSDLNHSLYQYAESLSLDNERLSELRHRIDLLQTLLSKYRQADISGLINLRNQLEQDLQKAYLSGEGLQKLSLEIEELETLLFSEAQELHSLRTKASEELKASMETLLAKLSMEHARISFDLSTKETLSLTGISQLNLLFQSNLGSNFLPLDKIASGGELSRVMLCIKAIKAQKQAMPTLIFDEIDSGVSGEVANKMGDLLKSLGQNRQVLSISHLPQIAGKANHQYKVFKEVRDGFTISEIRKLSNNERIDEIASMISGSKLTDISRLNARQLLEES